MSYLACDYDRLYPAGAGFPEPHAVADGSVLITDTRGWNVGHVVDLFPAMGYGAAFAPDIFVEQTPETDYLWPLYRSLAVKAAPAVVMVAIDGALCAGSVVYAVAHDRRAIIYETQRPNDRVAALPPAGDILAFGPVHDFADPLADYLFLTSAGSSNYGHFLVDDLPRLKGIDTLRALHPDRKQVVVLTRQGNHIDRIRLQAIRLLAGGEVEVVFLEPDKLYRFARLHYVSPVSSHPVHKNPQALRWVAERATVMISDETAADAPDRIFVRRREAAGRDLLNADVLARMLAGRGFATVYAEDYSFNEQVGLFRRAKRIVGQMGAAMTNTIFAPITARVLHLAPSGWVEPFYWDLAVACGHEYRVLYGAATDSDSAPHRRSFTINPTPLERAVGAP